MTGPADSARIPIVDSHHHFWSKPSLRDYPWMTDALTPIRRTFGPDDLRPLLAACDVTQTILVQTRSSLEETKTFLELAAGTDFIAGVVGWVDLTDPHLAAVLAELRAGPGGRYLKGIRHQVHDEPDPDWLLRDDVLNGLRAVQEAGLVYDLLVRPRELPATIEVARCIPDLTLVIDHIAKPPIAAGAFDAWAGEMETLSRFEHMYVKLSGMVTEAQWSDWTVETLRPYAERVLTWFGPERVMFGSDWPVCLLAASYEDVFATCCALIEILAADRRENVLGRNAIRVYRLDQEGEP